MLIAVVTIFATLWLPHRGMLVYNTVAVLTGGARASFHQHRRQSSYAAPSSDYGVPAGPVIGGGGSSAPSSGYGVPQGPVISAGGSRPQPSKPSYKSFSIFPITR